MIGIRTTILAAAALVGASFVAGGASAAPIGAGLETAAPAATIEQAQVYFGFGPGVGYGYGGGYGPGYGYYGPRPAYGYGGGYGGGYYGPRYGYGRRVVCRFRPTPYGPRRVCFRRY